jgi:ABC-type transport system involved in multi-copper enzyme maturation permease subunit
VTAPYRSTLPAGRDGFWQALHAEWTKFRTVRGWVTGTAVGLLLMILFGLLTGIGSRSTYSLSPTGPELTGHPPVPIGPDGEAVEDSFYLAHQTLAGDGALTARVTSLTGISQPSAGPDSTGGPQGLTPWSKAGLIIKASTRPGAAYAAIMVTPGHGVRMQDNFTGDTAGPAVTVAPGAPRWLRLVRSGETITGYTSADGATWVRVGTARLARLPRSVPAGMFVASPQAARVTQSLGGGGTVTAHGPSLATATFDRLARQGTWSGDWSGQMIQATENTGIAGLVGMRRSGGTVTLTGTGDIAPDVAGSGSTVEQTLVGGFATVTAVVVLAVLFVTTEYRRGLIRTSLIAAPRRGRTLAAKAVVVAAVAFLAGAVAAGVTVPVAEHFLRANGNFIYPVPWPTEVRVIGGTAALLAVAAVLALALGTILRRSAAAVAAIIVLVVLPYIMATAGVLPPGPSQWLLRLTPAAGFAIQQSMPEYAQVSRSFTPAFGFYPLPPWAGFAVLCGYAAVALGAASYLLRRRDA